MMVSDTENRKAASWLPDHLLNLEDREDLLANVNPALLLAGDGRLPIWASDAAARALGFRNADVFMRRRLADAAPGAQRLAELASTLEAGEAPRLERLRFYVGFRRVSVTAACQVIHLVNGSRALLVSFPAEAADDEEEIIAPQSDMSGVQTRAEREAELLQAAASASSPTPNDDAARGDELSALNSSHHDLAEPFLMESEPADKAEAIASAPASLHSPSDALLTTPSPAWIERPMHTRRMQRFVFTLDEEGNVLSVSPALAEAVGETHAFKAGDNLIHIVTALDARAGLQIEHAIAARQVWSDLRIGWPVAGSTLILPITLAALPNLVAVSGSNTGQDLGFSGFGRLHFDQAIELPSTPLNPEFTAQDEGENGSPVPPDDAEVLLEEAQLEDPQARVEVIETAQEIQSHHAQHSQHAQDNQYGQDNHIEENALTALPPPSRLDEINEEAPSDKESPSPAHHGEHDIQNDEEEQEPDSVLAQNSPPAPDDLNTEDATALPQPPESPAPLQPSNITQLPPRPVKPSDQPANVVTLRAGQAPPANGTTPQQGGLSLSERHAFREIAKALGARFDEDAPVDSQRARAAAIRGYNAQRQRPVNSNEGENTPKPEASEGNIPFWPENAFGSPKSDDFGTDSYAQEVSPNDKAGKSLSLLDKIPIGLLVLKGDEALFANRTLLDLTGYADFAHFLDENGVQAIFRKSSQPRNPQDGFDPIVLATREGEMIPVDAHLQLIEWQGSHATLISLRRASELEQGRALRSVAVDLRRARAEATELRNILDTATDGVLTLDEDGKILSMNSAAEALFGLNQNEIVGESFIQLLMNESHAEALDYIGGMRANGVKSVLNDGREVKGRERKGGLIPLFMTLGRISEEEPRRFCAVLRDLTAWKQAEAQLQEAKRAAETASAKKSDFLTRISHEIRTPINAMIGFAEVMEEERLGPINNPRYKEYLGDIRVSGHHIVSLVNDLLDLAKIEAGRLELSFVATDINAIVTSCIALMQPQANSARVLVRSQIAAKLPKVVADERSVRQIVLNMLSNATRYTQSGGQVIVSTAMLDNGEAVIRIRDTGVGMSKAEIEKALEPFQQVGSAQKSGGTGLGLPLTKALVEANRAHFSLRSTPGEGTLVEISFPATRVLAE